jgi:hypothetical protein
VKPWSEMSPRERDVLVAEKVIGWKMCTFSHSRPKHRSSKDFPGTIINNWDSKGPHNWLESPDGQSKVYLCGCEDVGEEIPHYSTDIAAAWEVVEKLCHYSERSFLIQKTGAWLVRFQEGVFMPGETAPEAICLAALKAVDVDFKMSLTKS